MKKRSRSGLVVAIAVCILIAGCGGFAGGPGANETDDEGLDEGLSDDAGDDEHVDSDGDGTSTDDNVSDDANESDDSDAITTDDEADDTDDDSYDQDEQESSNESAGNGDESDGTHDADESLEPDQSLLTLVVVDEDGEPLEGVDVFGLGAEHDADIPREFSGETDDDGLYTDEIYENEYEIDLEFDGYESKTFDHVHDEEHEVTAELDSENDSGEVTLEVVHPGTGEGMATELRTNATESGTHDTNQDGEVVLEDVEPGEYSITATELPSHPSSTTESTEFTVEETPSTVEVEGVPFPEDCRLDIEVVDGETGDPIDGASIGGHVEMHNHTEIAEVNSAETDADGAATLVEICGEWEIMVSADDYEQQIERLDLEENDSATVELESETDN
ncbi:hypothetical protein [Natrononativus amylolyticus]|uniref:hypothetical protein n=1 Tax=Natrononativus amylolyticus TaxID=2963434 RepID=UPI0020CEEF39|nr:hypothetical protein [Natrononativus amylolyticus]